MLTLASTTPPAWVHTALADFDAFLLDHASCERKASAVGMSFVVRYPDRPKLIDPMIRFAREELQHFHQVYRLIAARGLQLLPDQPDEYANLLLEHVRDGREERFLDRLLVSGLIEARGAERIRIVAAALTDEKLRVFYEQLARAEDTHRDLFVELALMHFPQDVVRLRLRQLIDVEAAAIAAVPYRSALH